MAISTIGAVTAQTTPEGMTLVGVLGNSTSASNTGNTRYVDVLIKANTQYVLRYYPSVTTSATAFPTIYYYKDSDSSYSGFYSAVTTTANNVYEDRIFYNTVSGITKLLFDTTVSQVSGFVAIYEASSAISKPAAFYPVPLFTNTSYTWSPGHRSAQNSIFNMQMPTYALAMIQTPAGTYTKKTTDGISWSDTSWPASQSTWTTNPMTDPTGRLWATSGAGDTYTNTSILYYSDNAGSTWTQLTATHPVTYYNRMLPPAYSPVNGGMLFTFRSYAMGKRSMYSTNNGATWTTQEGPYLDNQGYGIMVLGFSQGFVLMCDYQNGAYVVYMTTNGTTFTQSSVGYQPGSFMSDYNGGYKLITAAGYEAFMSSYSGSTTGRYIYLAPGMSLGNPTYTVPASNFMMYQTKNFWVGHNSSLTTGNTYYTAPYVYTSGAAYPQAPETWTTRTQTQTTNNGPMPGFKNATTSDIYFAANNTNSTTGAKAVVTPAGFTAL